MITISFYCSLISHDDIEIRIVLEFSSCYFIRSVYASAPTSHIFFSKCQFSKYKWVVCSFQASWFRSWSCTDSYIIMRSQMVIVPFALYICATASSEKMSSRKNVDTAFVISHCDHDYNWLCGACIQTAVVLCSVPMYIVLHSIMELMILWISKRLLKIELLLLYVAIFINSNHHFE